MGSSGYKRRFGQMVPTAAEQQQRNAQLKEHLAKAEMLSKKTHFNPQEVRGHLHSVFVALFTFLVLSICK